MPDRNALRTITAITDICADLIEPDVSPLEIVERLTERATEITRADFGAYFAKTQGPEGERWVVQALSGAPLKAFTDVGQPRQTRLFSATFEGKSIVRCDDVLTDPLFGSMGGMPPGHLPVRSYLAVPVMRKKCGETRGSLLFGNKLPGIFNEKDECLIASMAALAALALENADRRESLAREAEERARAENLLRSVIETSQSPIFVKDRQGRYLMANRRTLQVLKGAGATVDDPIGKDDAEMGVTSFSALMQNDQRIMHSGTAELLQEAVPDGRIWRVYESFKAPWRDSRGNVIGLVGVSHDITDLRREAEYRQLLLAELNHRVKNTLATIQSTVTATLRASCNPADFARAIDGRIRSIAASHNLLTDTNWTGAELGDVVRAEVSGVRSLGGSGLTVGGPRVMLQASAVTSMSMLVHELTTNAIKYGALANSHAVLSVIWFDDGETLTLIWSESCGGPAKPPKRTGFGTRLIQSIVRQFGGHLETHYNADGLVHEFTLRLDSIVPSPDPSPFLTMPSLEQEPKINTHPSCPLPSYAAIVA